MKCKKCNAEVDKKAVVCVNCGCKIKKPFYKKWWVWAIVAVLLIAAVSSSGNKTNDTTENVQSIEQGATETAVIYEAVDLSEMLEELKSNAMKAETKYQGKTIEIVGKISNFDSDGDYISIEPVNANEWNFESVMCYIKNDEQKNFLIEKNVGDTVTIRGKVKSIGEVMGYSVDIAEVE